MVVDETLILFKGRCKHRQHVRGKPHATGIKLFCLADEKGYIYDFWVYMGKHDDTNRSTTTHDYVWNLVEDLPYREERDYVVMADQFFGGEDIAKTLHSEGFNFILSTQANRPTAVFKDYLQRSTTEQGDVDFVVTYEGKEEGTTFKEPIIVSALTFYDSKKCNFFFNYGSSQLCNEGRKRHRPIAVALYNRFMNGVDKADTACNLYLNKHRRRKWTLALSNFIVKMVASHVCKIKNVSH